MEELPSRHKHCGSRHEFDCFRYMVIHALDSASEYAGCQTQRNVFDNVIESATHPCRASLFNTQRIERGPHPPAGRKFQGTPTEDQKVPSFNST